MSSTVTVTPAKGARGIGLVSIIAGIVLLLAGIGTWVVVANQLSAEEITVSDDASFLAGRHVNGPLTAYAQAEVINKHALEASGGKTYAELDQDDPTRQTVMTASFLRASLFTSVVAFGVCLLVMGLGVLFILVGIALRRLAGGPSVAVETPGAYTSSGDLSDAGRHVAPAHAAPTAPPAGPEPTTPTAPGRTSALSTPGAEARAAATPVESTGAPGTGTPSAPGSSPAASPDTTPPTTGRTGTPPERRGDEPTP
ncbi:hypothetical protein JOE63_001498 [Cellulosimicrobium cellulans]|uniref:hypothetical protein n=1 Tax=Cellulosimicrobium cellulans TaxID=1710 RepID=UPI0026CCEF1E|nr:hypothetical protein [Cellulosimicrobium cellulans]MBM7819021.1 hypothetical protein [Cellulosimicrobium cellulans]